MQKKSELLILVFSLFLSLNQVFCAEASSPSKLKIITAPELQKILKEKRPVVKKGDITFFSGRQKYLLLKGPNQTLRAQNLDTGNVVMMPGIIIVNLKKTANFSEFLQRSAFPIKSVAPQINTAFFKIKNYENPLLDVELLNQLPEVEKAELEVVETKQIGRAHV